MVSHVEYYPKLSDMFVQSVLCGICLSGIRHLYEISIAAPIGKSLGLGRISAKQKSVTQEITEVDNNNSHQSNGTVIKNRSRSTTITEDSTEENRERPSVSTLKKFCDSSWQFLFFLLSFSGGLCVLWDKPWFLDFMKCFEGFPNQSVPVELYWYYLLELGFYWSSIFSIPFEHRRKDFIENVIHHVATIIVMILSWTYNYCRVGATVLILHDAADSWLAAAKIAKYYNRKSLMEIMFVGFVVVWILTRLIYFPFVVLYCIVYKVPYVEDPVVVTEAQSIQYAVCRTLLLILQFLHLVWTYMIIQTALPKLKGGKSSLKDSSSDTEDDESDNEKDIHAN